MNSFGRVFRVSILGESHGELVGVLIDGCPEGIKINPSEFLEDLVKRKTGAIGTSSRIEDDIPVFKTGVFKNHTTGAPILITFENHNYSTKEYTEFRTIPRPGHADFTAMKKYKKFNDPRGSGHFSGRLTLGLVTAGVFAKKIINPTIIESKIISVGGSQDIESKIQETLKKKDSVGGIIECSADFMPIGLGEPFFDSLESYLSHIIFSIPGIKGIEFGAGFKSADMFGSDHNDLFIDKNGNTFTNNNGGINGGISNGNRLIFRVAVKPPSSIGKVQKTLNFQTGNIENLIIKGRHDACIALRIAPIITAATAIAMADLLLIRKCYSGFL